jgi:hypothetical protein
MQLLRLGSPTDVLEHWAVFREGHRTLRQMSNSIVPEDEYCKILTNLSVRGDDVCILVVRDGERDICYGVACNSTAPHSDRKTFEVTSFYHNPARVDATLFLKGEFEKWCRTQGVRSYLVTTRETRRTSGGTVDCFLSEKYGFRKAYLAFEHKL